jgi:hypothetical protein
MKLLGCGSAAAARDDAGDQLIAGDMNQPTAATPASNVMSAFNVSDRQVAEPESGILCADNGHRRGTQKARRAAIRSSVRGCLREHVEQMPRASGLSKPPGRVKIANIGIRFGSSVAEQSKQEPPSLTSATASMIAWGMMSMALASMTLTKNAVKARAENPYPSEWVIGAPPSGSRAERRR